MRSSVENDILLWMHFAICCCCHPPPWHYKLLSTANSERRIGSLCVSVSLYYQFLQSKEEHREKVMVFEWTLFAEEEFLHSPLCPLAA